MKLRKSMKYEEYVKYLEDSDIIEPTERQWLYIETMDGINSNCENVNIISWESFREYLEMISNTDGFNWKNLVLKDKHQNDSE